jgi:RimJ/RimL family protein N-acetyltransferase
LIGLEVQTGQKAELVGFYMLRGLDEGYPAPMYGVFIGYSHRNKGLASQSLLHAETTCRSSHIERLMLKVHPHNTVAKKLYEARGFTPLRQDPQNNNTIMEKSLFPDGT